jgi:phosphate transport system substrate-binding protein
MKLSKKIGVVAVAVGLVVGIAPAAQAADLQGAGASFPQLLIEACKVPFAKATGHSLTYAGGGSGAGKTASDNQTGDVWFSDSPHVSSTARKPLSISFEEIAAGKIQLVAKTIEEVLAENEAAAAAEKQAELDAMQDTATEQPAE